jgi:hypothetical protein
LFSYNKTYVYVGKACDERENGCATIKQGKYYITHFLPPCLQHQEITASKRRAGRKPGDSMQENFIRYLPKIK